MRTVFILIFTLAQALAGRASENKIVRYQRIGVTQDCVLKFRNDTSSPLTGITSHVDCGCIIVKSSPATIVAGDTKEIILTIRNDNPQRKENHLVVSSSTGKITEYKLVNYFYSQHAQVFGDTFLSVRSLEQGVEHSVVVLGDKSICDIKINQTKTPYILSKISNISFIEGSDGCFKRILTFTGNSSKLSELGYKTIRVWVDITGVLNIAPE